MTRISTLLLALLLLLPTALRAEESSHIGYFKNITGEVSIDRSGTTIPAETGALLQSRDIITTRSNSSAGIIFIDNTRLSLGENTEANLKEYTFIPIDQEYAFSLYLKKGKALYSSGKLSKLAPEKVTIQTPKATVGVRGTKFLVQVD